MGMFARDHLVADPRTSMSPLMVFYGVGIVGHIVPNPIGDRLTGPFNVLILFSVGACILAYCWVVHTTAGVYVFAIIYGFIAAALKSLFPATATILATDSQKTGVRLCMVLNTVSLACLTRPPIAGALVQIRGGSYIYAQLFAATSIMVGAPCLMGSRASKSGWDWAKV